jgi:hypothetical protein
MTNTSEPTGEDFLAFCREQDADARFDPRDAKACAGFQFLKSRGYAVRGCGVRRWYDTKNNWHRFPEVIGDAICWAGCQVRSLDDTLSFGSLTKRLEEVMKGEGL